MVGYAYWERGRPTQALTVMEESIELSKTAGFVVPQVITQADLAAAYAQLGAVERGYEAAYLALAAAETKTPRSTGVCFGHAAHLQL